MPNQENSDSWQEKHDQIRPIKLVIQQSGGKEVSKHDDENDRSDHMHQDLKPEKVRDFMAQGRQVGVDAAQDVQLNDQCVLLFFGDLGLLHALDELFHGNFSFHLLQGAFLHAVIGLKDLVEAILQDVLHHKV